MLHPKSKKNALCLCIVFLLFFALPFSSFAHSGKTDSNGGHYDHSTGKYHYHHGYSAHSHYDMDGDGDLDCPYNFNNQTNHNSSSGSNYGDNYGGSTSGNSSSNSSSKSSSSGIGFWDVVLSIWDVVLSILKIIGLTLLFLLCGVSVIWPLLVPLVEIFFEKVLKSSTDQAGVIAFIATAIIALALSLFVCLM